MSVSRRKVLMVGGCALCAGALGCGPDAPQPLGGDIPAGNVKDLPQGTLRAIGGRGVAIGRDAGGIYALSLICTHEGCDMSMQSFGVSAGGITCDCHGSVFDAQGNVLRGKVGGQQPLPHLVVTEDASGNLTIHGDQETAPATRIPAA